MPASQADRSGRGVMCKGILMISGIALILLHAPEGLAQQLTVLRGGTLIDGTGASPRADTDVVIEGN
ncbi:MAG: hypothetical protein OEO82_07805, partial [Gammaproteobacteria bacterium]|nr:hypothetical protein [Gammaproteobacteria bacterium]